MLLKHGLLSHYFLSAYPMPSGNKPPSEAVHMATGPTGIHPLTLSYCTGFSPRGTDNTTPSGTAILEGFFRTFQDRLHLLKPVTKAYSFMDRHH